MIHVITEPCVGCKDAACVTVCPADAIHPRQDERDYHNSTQLFIDPDSCIGCTGAIYAIRRALYTPIPADTTLDDVVIPMRLAVAGYRGYEDYRARTEREIPLVVLEPR